MPTTRRKSLRGQKSSPVQQKPVLVDTTDASDDTAYFVHAVIAALGLRADDFAEAQDQSYAAAIQVSGDTIHAETRQWHHPDPEANFEHWLATTCLPVVEDPTLWAVVQTGAERFDMLAAAMAYAHRDDGVLLIDADASEILSRNVLEATEETVEVLTFDFALPSPHIYVLNAPSWEGVAMLLQIDRANPLNSVFLPDTLRAARQHFAHTIIDCGADLFLAQRLAAQGTRVIHVDDCARPLYVDLKPYKRIDYFAHDIPQYGTRGDFEFIVNNTRRRARMRRWLKRGDAV